MHKKPWEMSVTEYCAKRGVVLKTGFCLDAAPWQIGDMNHNSQTARLDRKRQERSREKQEFLALSKEWAFSVKGAFLRGECSLLDLYNQDAVQYGYDRAFYLIRDWIEEHTEIPSPFRLHKMQPKGRERLLREIQEIFFFHN